MARHQINKITDNLNIPFRTVDGIRQEDTRQEFIRLSEKQLQMPLIMILHE